jgi:1-acyl-sn-glycerol-3-phosphate acyltransferase
MKREPPVRFLTKRPPWTDWMPWLMQEYLMGIVEMETAGTEVHIPKTGPVVLLFCPHAGWMEAVVLDKSFERVGRPAVLWMTKAENRGLPRWLLGDRFIGVDREHPEPSVMRVLHAVLKESVSPAPALGTSIEGTRFGNPDDPADVRTLGAFKTGLVRVAMRTGTPIVPALTLGTDTLASGLEEVYKAKGTLAAFRELRRLRRNRHPIQVRFLPLYTAHLSKDDGAPSRKPRVRAEFHTEQLRQQMVAEILAIEPDYPVGG